jgi:hypothetical protein
MRKIVGNTVCLLFHQMISQSKSNATGTREEEKHVFHEPVTYRNGETELQEFDDMICTPDHFHPSCHVMVNSARVVDKVIHPNQENYNAVYKGYADGLMRSWTHGRMDITAQELMKFESKFAGFILV